MTHCRVLLATLEGSLCVYKLGLFIPPTIPLRVTTACLIICKRTIITFKRARSSINRADTSLSTKIVIASTTFSELTNDCQPEANGKEEKNGSYTINDKANDVQNRECNHLCESIESLGVNHMNSVNHTESLQ